jgi:hypothetical protein
MVLVREEEIGEGKCFFVVLVLLEACLSRHQFWEQQGFEPQGFEWSFSQTWLTKTWAKQQADATQG